MLYVQQFQCVHKYTLSHFYTHPCLGKNGRPNLTAANGRVSSTSDENVKPNGVRHITGPDGTKWVCLLAALVIAKFGSPE